MTTAVVLFTRDLRVHDHPALTAACRRADRVVPLFVFDEAVIASRYATPNRLSALRDSVEALRSALRDRGGELVVRRGDPVDEVHRLAVEVAADELHLSADVSRYARRREEGLRRLARDRLGDRLDVHSHPGVVLVAPGQVRPAAADHFRVFSAYHRRWAAAAHRVPEPAPVRVRTPPVDDIGRLPDLAELAAGPNGAGPIAAGLPPAGEPAARARADAWFDGPVERYDRTHELLAEPGTSMLSPHLHLGTISVAELAARVDRDRPGPAAFLRQLCWRDFNHQLLAARPDLPEVDLRSRGDEPRDEPRDEADAIAAWRDGRTGYPVVDAGMRQLRAEGWMHNRARMITASFLTKHLGVDWRIGAWHFMDHLVDGDLANNFAQWQWAAGTGTDSRPNRMFNPVTQGRRHDPDGAYVRAYVPELADVDPAHVHAPWESSPTLLSSGGGYPPPIVDHREARARFLGARGGAPAAMHGRPGRRH